jgi:hypothetical protein
MKMEASTCKWSGWKWKQRFDLAYRDETAETAATETNGRVSVAASSAPAAVPSSFHFL